MAVQLVIVMEADERSRTDYFYIKSVLDKRFNLQMLNDVKISPVFMGGKGNYDKKKVTNSINSHIKGYSLLGKTHVLYCFDTDRYDSNPDEKRLLYNEEKFCRDNGYEFVWFCRDIEEVFLGKSAAKSEKRDKARQYKVDNGIEKVNLENLKATAVTKGKSNLLLMLEKYL